jgi:Spy/CpxP family protein refolding chaperone
MKVKVCLVLITVLVALPAVAQHPPEGPPRPDSPELRNRMRELGLTNDQRDRLQELNRRMGREAGDLFRKLYGANKQLEELFSRFELDNERINVTVREIHQLQLQLMKNRIETQRELRKILKPDQLVKLNEITKQHLEQRRKTDREPGRRGPFGLFPGGKPPPPPR